MQDLVNLVRKFNLPEYHTRALSHLIILSRSKATTLAKVSDVPRTRIYDVLEDLFKIGLVKYKPGRPSVYSPINPRDMPRKFILWKKEKLRKETLEMESMEKEMNGIKLPEYNSMLKELLNMVQVGTSSEIETEKIIRNAEKEVDIISHALEHYGRLKEGLISAHSRGIPIKILLAHPSRVDKLFRLRQKSLVKWMKRDMPDTEVRFTRKTLPIKATIVDPAEDYRAGSAVFLVEQRDIPLFMREAAVTCNPSLVFGLKNYFDYIWKKEN